MLISKQADVTAVFLHATLEGDKKVFVKVPLGFKQHWSNRKFNVLCLKNTRYGLHQSPHVFCKYLTKKFVNSGLTEGSFDPFLFIGKNTIATCYVDDQIVLARNEKDIVELAI